MPGRIDPTPRRGASVEGPQARLGIYPQSVRRSGADEGAADAERRRIQARRELYGDLKTAALILRAERPDRPHRISQCRWTKIASEVSLHLIETPAGLRAAFRGIKVCGNVWGCPVCSARISQARRDEVNAALAWARGAGVVPVLLTLTARHGAGDSLPHLLDGMKEAKRALRRHRAWTRLAFAGSITATEITHGANGWHPHFHEVVFIEADDEAAALAAVAPLGDAWRASLRGKGLDGAAAAFDAQGAAAAGNYLAKFGAAEELTLTGAKRGRQGKAGRGRSPRELLRDAGAGDGRARALWLEYLRTTSGRRRRQLVWSPRLKGLVGLDDVADEDVAESEAEDATEVAPLAAWDNKGWRRVRPKRVRLMEAAERGGSSAVRAVEAWADDPLPDVLPELVERDGDGSAERRDDEFVDVVHAGSSLDQLQEDLAAGADVLVCTRIMASSSLAILWWRGRKGGFRKGGKKPLGFFTPSPDSHS